VPTRDIQRPVLAGRWAVERALGAGGMATVWSGRDLETGEPVAVKLLTIAAGDESGRIRFEREAAALARIDHPNVVRVRASGTDDVSGQPFLVMDLERGPTLAELLGSEGALEPERASALVAAVADAAQAAHQTGLVHRDLKAANVIVREGDDPVVIDFGISRGISDPSLTQAGVTWGTAHGMAPELLAGSPADARSDVYALGCLLYETLTGEPPFPGDTALAVAYRHAHEAVPAPSAVRGDIPPAFDAVVARATAPEPGDRYESAAAFAGALRAAALPTQAVATTLVAANAGDTQPLPVAPVPVASVPVAVGRPVAGDGRVVAVAVAAVMALLAVGALAATTESARQRAHAANTVPAAFAIPSVTGQTVTDAVQTLTDAGFAVRQASTPSESVHAGRVASQDPLPGVRVPHGSVVLIVVSTGPPVPAPAPAPAGKRAKHGGGGHKGDD